MQQTFCVFTLKNCKATLFFSGWGGLVVLDGAVGTEGKLA